MLLHILQKFFLFSSNYFNIFEIYWNTSFLKKFLNSYSRTIDTIDFTMDTRKFRLQTCVYCDKKTYRKGTIEGAEISKSRKRNG